MYPNLQDSGRSKGSKELKAHANSFLTNKDRRADLLALLDYLKDQLAVQRPLTPCLLVLETLFAELLKTYELHPEIVPLKPQLSAEDAEKQWRRERYDETFEIVCSGMEHEKSSEAVQALVSAVRLLGNEARHPIEAPTLEAGTFPTAKLKAVLQRILSKDSSRAHLIGRFSEYASYPDILHFSWKLLPSLTPKGASPSDTYTKNFLDLVNVLSTIAKDVDAQPNFCLPDEKVFDYNIVRKAVNKVWSCVMLWRHTEETHRQLLIVLLEKVLAHLDKPILLTDFLMESLNMGGVIGLLALQGIFILIQQHNLTYPNIYEKLYSMFEPEIFHTKFKARLFYLADIFLSSSHLPEALVAAFAKRLARLALVAPPQDITIILYFIGNLILRHQGLKRLICHPNGGQVPRDPFIMDEGDPLKSHALESSLWEIAALQSHAIPSIASVAKFIHQPLPQLEWDLGSVLELNENDVFDQEISRRSREYALSFERPMSMFLPKSDRTLQFWNLV